MSRGLNRSGDFRTGNPVTLPKTFGNVIDWTLSPVEFGNPVDWSADPSHFGNPVTWFPNPAHFGNEIGESGATPTPTFTPPAGTYGVPQVIQVTSDGADAIFYTTNGSTPDSESTLYIGSVFVPSSMTIKAIAYSNGVASAVGSAAYVISLV